jgi:hypothetical protein
MFVPPSWLLYQVVTEQFGPSARWHDLLVGVLGYGAPHAGLVTPAMTISGWGRLIDVRRMIGVTALA